MAGGGSGDEVHYIGVLTTEPDWPELKTTKSSRGGSQVSVHQQTYRTKNEDKQSGSYERYTAKDKKVSGEPFKERSGRVGYKDEYTTSASYKTGDKNGYTEYYREERVKHVNYDNSSSKSNSKSVGYYPKYNKY